VGREDENINNSTPGVRDGEITPSPGLSTTCPGLVFHAASTYSFGPATSKYIETISPGLGGRVLLGNNRTSEVLGVRGETSRLCKRALACKVIFSGFDFFLPKSWSFLTFHWHQRNVEMEFKFASGWLRESNEIKTEAKKNWHSG
jgi:hypothetical protein